MIGGEENDKMYAGLKEEEVYQDGFGFKHKAPLSPEGLKHDQNKPDLSLLPPKALIDVTRAYDYGVLKYGRDNWRKGLKFSKIYAGIQRHLLAWLDGEETNVETNPDGAYPHLAAAAWGCLTLLEYTRTQKYARFDDRYRHSAGTVSIPSCWTPQEFVPFTITTTDNPEGISYVLKDGEVVPLNLSEIKTGDGPSPEKK